MPVVHVPIPEVDDSISRAIAFALIEQVKHITNIPDDADVTYIGEGGERRHFKSSTSPADAPVRLASDRQISVEVEEIPNESSMLTQSVHQRNQLPDFYDKDIGVDLKPVYSGFDFILTVVYRTPSRAEAIRWRNDARTRYSQARIVNMHEVEYMYQLTPICIAMIEHFFNLKETHIKSGYTFSEYFARNRSNRATEVSDTVGGYRTIFFKEKSIRIQAVFDFTFEPRKQERNEGLGWEVQFTYTAEVAHPTEFSIRYPIVINNQPIDTKYIPLVPPDSYEQDKRMGAVTDAFYFMEEPVFLARHTNIRPMVRVPEFDEWTPNTLPSKQRPIASWLMGLQPKMSPDSPQETVLMNINNLSDIYIDPDVMEWIKDVEWQHMHMPHISAVQFHLYRNESLSSFRSLEVRKNGDIVLKDPIDITKRYRLVLSVVEKIRYVDIKSLKRLARYPKAMCKILAITNTSSGELYDLLSYLDLSNFAYCASNAGTDYETAVKNIINEKSVMAVSAQVRNIESMSGSKVIQIK